MDLGVMDLVFKSWCFSFILLCNKLLKTQAFYYVSRSLGLALISKVVLLFHVMLAGAPTIWGLDWVGTSKMTHSLC